MSGRSSQQIQGGFAASVPTGRRAVDSFGREVIGHLKAILGANSPTVLVGASTGSLAGQLHRAKVQILALEQSEVEVGQLRRSLPAVPVIRAADDSLPLQTSSAASLILGSAASRGSSGGVQPDVDDPALRVATMIEVRRVIRPGGLLACISQAASKIQPDQSPPGEGSPASWGFEPVESVRFGAVSVSVWR